MTVNYSIYDMKPSVYEFDDITYIYGKNNVGKSVMIYALDFVLGKSNADLNKKEGLENISSIELEINDNNDTLFIKRSRNDEYFYKISKEDEYFQVDNLLYKKEISNFINKGDDKYLVEFYQFNEENLTFRAFTFFNFIDEKGLGNLANIFARAKDYEHQRRARKIMTYIYNYKNIHEICELSNKEKKLQQQLELYNETKVRYNYLYLEILKYLTQLNLETSGEMNELYERFKNYKNGFNRNYQYKCNDDLNELIKASYSLSEELKYQENLEMQSQKLISRNKRSEIVLNAFRDLIKENKNWNQYFKYIEELIYKNKSTIDILSVKDYKGIIDFIKTKKSKIDQKIYSLSKGMNKYSYEQSLQRINILDNLFENIRNIKEIKEYETIKKELIEAQNKIKDLKKLFDNHLIESFCNIFLQWYSLLNKKVKFVTDDFNNPGFCIDFNPIESSLVGQRYLKNNINEKYVYNPGSMARETTWQILACLANLKVINDNFKELPFMRVLIIDGINQPFDETPDTYPEVFKLIKQIAKDIGIQLIVVSTIDREKVDKGKQININEGFNKAHNI